MAQAGSGLAPDIVASDDASCDASSVTAAGVEGLAAAAPGDVALDVTETTVAVEGTVTAASGDAAEV